MAWRMANVYVGPSELPVWNELLEPPVIPEFPVSLCRAVYDFDKCPEPENEVLREVVRWHRNAMAITRLYGDDFGNISTMPQNAVFGMNRLNHNTEIFYEYLRICNEGIRKTFIFGVKTMHNFLYGGVTLISLLLVELVITILLQTIRSYMQTIKLLCGVLMIL